MFYANPVSGEKNILNLQVEPRLSKLERKVVQYSLVCGGCENTEAQNGK